jgi:thiol-disulfide isomerase/thioredoxin
MKTLMILLTNLFLMQCLISQPADKISGSTDPFCQMIRTIFATDVMCFKSTYKIKNVFEKDTTAVNAHVKVIKQGNHISYLLITPEEGEEELLFYRDSAWVVDHVAEKFAFIGTGAKALEGNNMARFFSFTIFDADTMVSMIKPYWEVIDENRDYTVVSLSISESQADLSDPRVEFTITNSDHLLHKELQSMVYMKADTYYQEQIFTDYRFPPADKIIIPGNYPHYDKDLSIVQYIKPTINQDTGIAQVDIYLESIELNDLSGNPFQLPEEGLIFIDLWYVGCAPCMKSAPIIEKLYFDYNETVYFFSINEVDMDIDRINSFRDKMGITFPVLIGKKGKLAAKVTGTGGYPVFFLMDAGSGKVLWSMTGYSEDLEEILSEAIKNNL